MLADIDHLFRPISYNDFMRIHVPKPASSPPHKAMQRAKKILASGLNLAYAKDDIREKQLYPILASICL